MPTIAIIVGCVVSCLHVANESVRVDGLSASAPQAKAAQGPAKLYTDAEIEKLAKDHGDKKAIGLEAVWLDVVPDGESYARAKVFKTLNIDDMRLGDFRKFRKGNVVSLLWQVSPSYDISCMTGYDRENKGLEYTDPNRPVYGIRIFKRSE
jgi:hypothetical protein